MFCCRIVDTDVLVIRLEALCLCCSISDSYRSVCLDPPQAYSELAATGTATGGITTSEQEDMVKKEHVTQVLPKSLLLDRFC